MSLLSKYINRQLAAYQSELVQTHYQEVENMYRQIRGWRHDYRNHIQVLKSYAKDGDLAQISKYLDELDEDLSTVDTVIKTGNKMTDAILNSKISLAKSKHIPVVADAHVPVALKTSEMDFCIIIGNLFDNAIEASLQLPGREAHDPHLHGHEKYPALHVFHQLYRNEKTEKNQWQIPHHKRTGTWIRTCPYR